MYVPVLEQGLLYWEGASGKRQVTADMSDIQYANLLHFSHQIFLCIIKRPIQNWKYRYLTPFGIWYSAEQEWTKSFAYVGLADNDD